MSCLFESLAVFFKHNDHKKVRQQICNYLESNGALIDGIETSTILQIESPNYVNNMRLTSTWGGGIEIQSACNIWKVRIIVHNLRQNNTIEFIPVSGSFSSTIEISWTGNHYTPLRKYS